MKNMIQELWHGNIIPQEDSRTNSNEMKELLGYMSRHYEELEKSFTDEQKETFEKFHDCWSEYMSLTEQPPSNMPSAPEHDSRWRCNRTQTNNELGIGEISDANFLKRISTNAVKYLDVFIK